MADYATTLKYLTKKMKNNFKMLIVDDEVLIAEFLKDELVALGYSAIELAHTRKQALQLLTEFKPHLVLLDIRMKGEKEGIEIAEEINNTFKTPFIYITAHSDKTMVQEALGTKPAGYITKPFKAIDLYAAVHLVESNYEKINEQFLIIKDGYADVKVAIDDILYVQSDDNYIHIYTSSKKHTIRNTMEWFKENTPEGIFHRSHRSYFVNVTKITKSTAKSVFIGDIEIPVSRGNQIKLDDN
jgi:two-component system, LytTR family, response regulator LytT